MPDDATKYLIVNADDFGLSPGVNRGIIEAHERGIVTSTSLMVRPPAAREAADYARGRRSLSVGLHVDLGEWVYRGGGWSALYEVVDLSDPAAVREEVARQLEAFHRLTGSAPTHLDSHQHVHRSDPARTVLVELARRHRVPLRHFTPGVRYCGDFYGQSGKGEPWPQGISVDALVAIIESLQPGVTELACHPGDAPESGSVYGPERRAELHALCHPRVRAAVVSPGTRLRTFAEVSAVYP